MCPFWSIISTGGGGWELSTLSPSRHHHRRWPITFHVRIYRCWVCVRCAQTDRHIKIDYQPLQCVLVHSCCCRCWFFFCLGWRLLFLLEAVFYSVFSAIYLVEFIEVIAIPCDSMILLYGMRLAAWDLHPKKNSVCNLINEFSPFWYRYCHFFRSPVSSLFIRVFFSCLRFALLISRCNEKSKHGFFFVAQTFRTMYARTRKSIQIRFIISIDVKHSGIRSLVNIRTEFRFENSNDDNEKLSDRR